MSRIILLRGKLRQNELIQFTPTVAVHLQVRLTKIYLNYLNQQKIRNTLQEWDR